MGVGCNLRLIRFYHSYVPPTPQWLCQKCLVYKCAHKERRGMGCTGATSRRDIACVDDKLPKTIHSCVPRAPILRHAAWHQAWQPFRCFQFFILEDLGLFYILTNLFFEACGFIQSSCKPICNHMDPFQPISATFLKVNAWQQ